MTQIGPGVNRALGDRVAYVTATSAPVSKPSDHAAERGEFRAPSSLSGSRRLGARAELRPVQRPQLALDVPLVAVDAKEAVRELERFLHGRRLEDRVAADHFLGLGGLSLPG